MADDWDAEDFDVEKGFVDESKEEEEEDLALAEVVVPEPQPRPKTEASKPKKSKQKKAEKQAQEIGDAKTDDDKLSAAEERRKREELQKESDLRLAMDTFGASAAPAAGSLDAMEPKTEEEFTEFKDALANKITKYGASAHYNGFLEQLLIKCCTTMDAGDLRHLSAVLSTLASEKQKAKSAKSATKKKVKASLGSRAVGKGSKRLDDMEYDNELGAEFDDFI